MSQPRSAKGKPAPTTRHRLTELEHSLQSLTLQVAELTSLVRELVKITHVGFVAVTRAPTSSPRPHA